MHILLLAWLIISNGHYPGELQWWAWGAQQATFMVIVVSGIMCQVSRLNLTLFSLALPALLLLRPIHSANQLPATLFVMTLGAAYFIGPQLNWAKLSQAALVVFLVYVPLSVLVQTNPNIVAMELWALFFLSLGYRVQGTGYRKIPVTYNLSPVTYPLALFSIANTHSEGALLALGAGLLYHHYRWPGLAIIPPALIALLWLKWDDFSSLGARWELYKTAWTGFTLTPIMGHGVGVFQYTTPGGFTMYQPHNIVLDFLYSFGLVGVAVVGIGYRLQVTGDRKLTPVSCHLSPFLIAFATHALIDNPHWTALPALAGAALLGVFLENRKE